MPVASPPWLQHEGPIPPEMLFQHDRTAGPTGIGWERRFQASEKESSFLQDHRSLRIPDWDTKMLGQSEPWRKTREADDRLEDGMTGWLRGQHVSGSWSLSSPQCMCLHQIHQPWSVISPEEQDKVHEVNSLQSAQPGEQSMVSGKGGSRATEASRLGCP